MDKLTRSTSDIGKMVKLKRDVNKTNHYDKGTEMRIVDITLLGYSLVDTEGTRINGVSLDDVELSPQLMPREKLLSLVEEKINEVFLAYQMANSIESGDISPEDALRLDEMQEKLTNMVINVCEKNRALGKNARIVKITSGMTPECEVIATDAPDLAIEKQLAIINTMEEECIEISDAYEYLKSEGYYVEVVGSDNDNIEWECDAAFDCYDYDPDISLLER